MDFQPQYDHYELLVISFGMTNALITFIELMNIVFHPYLDSFMIVHL